MLCQGLAWKLLREAVACMLSTYTISLIVKGWFLLRLWDFQKQWAKCCTQIHTRDHRNCQGGTEQIWAHYLFRSSFLKVPFTASEGMKWPIYLESKVLGLGKAIPPRGNYEQGRSPGETERNLHPLKHNFQKRDQILFLMQDIRLAIKWQIHQLKQKATASIEQANAPSWIYLCKWLAPHLDLSHIWKQCFGPLFPHEMCVSESQCC